MKKFLVQAASIYTTFYVTRKLTTIACCRMVASVMTEEEVKDISDRLEARFAKK